MRSTRFPVLGVLAILPLFSVGCLMRCHHTAYGECLRPVEQVAASAPARSKVYTFLMNGADVFDLGGLKELECEIVRAGFPKVYYAQRFDEEWYYKELHRLHRTDPDNRFVLVGQGAAAKQLHELACRVTADNIPLGAVVFLDPVGWNGDTTDAPYRTKIIRSHHWRGSPRLITTESLDVFRTGHLHLADHPASVEALVEVLVESALRVRVFQLPIDCIPLLDENKPIPRPNEPKVVPPPPPGWNVLCPESGHG